MRVLIRISLVLGLLFSHIGPALAQPFAPEPDGPGLYHKAQAGLMPPAYGAAPAERTLLVAAALHSGGQFAPFTIYPSGAWPEAVVAGEFTGEGRGDAALSASFNWDAENDNRLHLFAQTSGGGLTRTQRLETGNQPTALATGDLNRDGWRDVVVANQDDDTLNLFLHAGVGLTATLTLPAGAGPDAVAVGDFNGDLREDIAAVHAISQTVGIYHQQAAGSFAAPVWLGLSSAGYNDIAAGDLNGDGYDDLVVLRGAGHTASQVAIFYQQDRTLGAPVFRTVEDGGFLVHGLAVGDVTGDGRDDIVVTAGGNAPQAYLNILVQQLDGTLPLIPTVYAAHHLPEAVEIGDANHDGYNDVAAVHAAWMSLSVYTQTVAGTLSAYESYALPYTDYYRPGGLALADVTGDGGVDVLLANHSSLPVENGLVVLANTDAAPTSTITNPALPIFITDTLTFPIEGQASDTATLLEISTDGGRTWAAQPADPVWSYFWDIPATDGSYVLLSRATDAAGQVQFPPARSRVIVDHTLPLGSLVINEGAAYTNVPTVTLAVSGSDFNDVVGMRFDNADEAFSAWTSFAPTQTWTLSAGDGIKVVRGQVRDTPGNSSVPFSDTIILDTTPPACGILINADAPYAASSQVTLTLTSEDANGVGEMRVRNASGEWTPWQAYVSTLPWNLAEADGVRTVEAQFRDILDNTSVACQDTITLDTTSPMCSIAINEDAPYTIQPTVTLTITGTDVNGIAQMRFSHDNTTWTGWEPVAPTRAWTLPSPDGLRTVYAQVQDTPGNSSAACLDTITLDTTSPVGFVIANNAALYTNSPTVTLTLGASDTHGVSHMRFSNTGLTWSAWQAYGISAAWTLATGDGLKTVYAQYRDLPGNLSGPYADMITLDTTLPTCGVLINDGATYVTSTQVMLDLTSTDANGVTEMRVRNASGSWTAWQGYSTNLPWSLTSVDGERMVEAQFRDVAGNVSAVCQDSIILDTTLPACSVVIAGGATYSAQPTVTLTLNGTDTNDVTVMRFSHDGSSWTSWEAYATTYPWTLHTPDGMRSVYAQVQDTPGNVSVACSDSIILDMTPPTGFVLVDGGALYTGVPTATLTLGASDTNGVAQMRFSNTGSTWSSWQPYAVTAAWTLASGDGLKTVYVEYRDVIGNISEPVTDSIILDTTPPGGSIIIDNGATYTRIPTVTLVLESSDAIPVADMRFSHDGLSWGTWEPYAGSRIWTLTSGDGVKPVYAQFRDTVGNISVSLADSIILDTTPPACQVFINGGASYATSSAVTLNVACSDANPPVQVRYSNDGSTWSSWEAYTSVKPWTLADVEGTRTVYIEAQDAPGNMGGPFTDTIILDTLSPGCTLSIDAAAPYATGTTVQLSISCSDVNGLNGIRLSNDGSHWDAWRSYATAVTWNLTAGDGLKTVYLQARDVPGNVSMAITDTIVLDTASPSCMLEIDGDAPFATSTGVTLTVSCSDTNGVAEIRFSNDGSNWEPWQAYTTSLAWQLETEEGLKTVYLQARDVPGNISAATTDTIVLDTIPPECILSVAANAPYTTQGNVTLAISCSDVNGMQDVRLSNDGSAWGAWQAYAATLPWTLAAGDGLKTVYLQGRDVPGNVTIPVTDTIILDTTPPACTLSIDGGAATTTAHSVLLTLSCNDTNNLEGIRLSNDGATWEPWRAYATSISWVLPAGDGVKAVYLQGRDLPGNISVPISDTILLDTILPSGGCTVLSNNGYVNNPMTTLSLWSYDENDVPDMQLRNGTAAWGSWTAFATPYPWTLPGGDGAKAVNCHFRDTPGNISPVYTTTVILDTIPPTCQITINNGEPYVNDLLVTLVLSSTDQYGVSDMRFSDNQSAWSSWQVYAPSRSWTLPEGSGAKTVWAQFRDLAGNVAQCQATVTVDLDPPTGTLVVNEDAPFTVAPTVTVTLVVTDTVSGVEQLCLGTSAPCVAWQPFDDTLPWTLAPIEDSPQTVCAWLKDRVGNVSEPLCDSITLDQTPPTGSLLINGGASHTNSLPVTLALNAADLNGVASMRFSHDGVVWQDWQPYAPSAEWVLGAGDGLKTVYGQYQDIPGNTSAPFSDTIVLHTTLPGGNIVINDGALYTRVPMVTLSFTAETSLAVTDMRLSHNGVTWGEWSAFAPNATWILAAGDGMKSAHVQFRDVAQNVSNALSDTILLDTVPPTGTVLINNGVATTTQPTVTLRLAALDHGSGVCEMQVRDADADWQDWQPYVTTLTWDLGPGTGDRSVEARFRDCAGNVGPVSEATVTLVHLVYLPLVLLNWP